MPVIGRLDSQVNDVLIEPVGNRRHREGRDERDPRAQIDDARPTATTNEAHGDDQGASPDANVVAHDDARRDARLPVWLL